MNVKGKPVTGVTLNRSSIIVSLNDTERLNATVTPSDATDKSVVWTSSNRNVVDVDSDGVITGRMVGTATVSARTADGGFTASCTVTVDRREKVVVKADMRYTSEDDNYFNIVFPGGKTWRSIGCDLSLDENCSHQPLSEDFYDSLTVPEQRYVDNYYSDYTFTEGELALIYRLDPLGMEYYMRNEIGGRVPID